jgi:hypothetical protein
MTDKIIKLGANYIQLDIPDDINYQLDKLSMAITLTIVGVVITLGIAVYYLMKGV